MSPTKTRHRDRAEAQAIAATNPKLTEQQELDKALLETLAKLGGQRVSEDALLRQGNRLILPETMSPVDALAYLEEYIEREEEPHTFSRTFRFRPWDGAHAMEQALKRIYGTAGIGRPQWTFFGKRPPAMRTIATGPNSTTQVPWGFFSVPLFHGELQTGIENDEEYGPLFQLTITCARKYRAQVEGLFEVIEQELRERSIYKGQAIDGGVDPEFLDLTGVDPNKVIFADEVQTQLTANVWSLLDHAEAMRQLDMPLKRAVLLEGPYGCGKTLAAFLTAQRAVPEDWTFIYCRPGKDNLGHVLATARLYQPAVVFFEDIDTISSTAKLDSEVRGDSVEVLLDMFDGITAKGTEILAVLTTNHPERIHKGMVRPGRLDSIIHIGALDTHGVQRMIEATVPQEHLASEIDYERIGEAMKAGDEDGFLPAFVKEAIDRSMRYAIARNGGTVDVLETQDFVDAALGLQPQLQLMSDAKEGRERDPLGTQFESLARRAAEDVLERTKGEMVHSGDELRLEVASNGS